jgi:hypothetical protein
MSYAEAVAADHRFQGRRVDWDVWLVGTDLDSAVRLEGRHPERPPGCVQDRVDGGSRVRVWARGWSEMVHECADRVRFYQDAV